MTTDEVRHLVATMSSGIVATQASIVIDPDDLSKTAVRDAMNGVMRQMAPSLLWAVEQTADGGVRIIARNVGLHDRGEHT